MRRQTTLHKSMMVRSFTDFESGRGKTTYNLSPACSNHATLFFFVQLARPFAVSFWQGGLACNML
jgi:hypothetical protein